MVFTNCNNLNMLNLNGIYGSNSFNNPLGSFFGNNGSIFGSGFNFFGNGCSYFTNCNGSTNYNALAGFGIASTLFNFGLQIASKVYNEKTSVDTVETVQDDIKGINKKISSTLKEIGDGVNIKNYNDYKVEDEAWYIYGMEEVKNDKLPETDFKTIGEKIKRYKVLILKSDQRDEKEQKEYEDLRNDYEVLKEQYDNHLKAIKAEKELNKKLEKREAEVKEKIEKVNDLLDKLANANDELLDKKLDELDGNKRNRATLDDVKSKFDDKGDLIDGAKPTKDDIRALILAYRTAKDDSEKEKYKEMFNAMYEKLEAEDRSNELRKAYSLINE